MATITAQLKNLRITPRKTRLVTDLVKGKSTDDAVAILKFTTKKAAEPIRKLIESAQANARDKGITGDLRVKEATVNDAFTLFRRMPAAQGQMKVIRKRNSHVFVELDEMPVRKKEKMTSTKPIAKGKESAKATA